MPIIRVLVHIAGLGHYNWLMQDKGFRCARDRAQSSLGCRFKFMSIASMKKRPDAVLSINRPLPGDFCAIGERIDTIGLSVADRAAALEQGLFRLGEKARLA